MKKEAAAALIGVSVRTLQRLTKKGQIAVQYLPGPKGEEAHYEEDELQHYLERSKPAMLMRPGDGWPDAMTHAATSDMTSDAAQKMLDALEAIAAPVRLSEKLLLSIPEAAMLSGIPTDKLRAAVKSGKLKAHKGIGHGLGRVKRSDLDAYIKRL